MTDLLGRQFLKLYLTNVHQKNPLLINVLIISMDKTWPSYFCMFHLSFRWHTVGTNNGIKMLDHQIWREKSNGTL